MRGLRAFRSRPASCRQRSDLVTLAHIKEQSRLSLGSYGRPRMTEELKEIGLNIGHRRVGRLMRQNGISVVRTRKHKVTTDSNHKFNVAPNLLDRDFTAERPNQKWAGDISYVWTREGWLYLAVILDLHSRRVIGWAVSNRMKRNLAIWAPKMAIAFRPPPKDCIHHTDRGSQYCSHDYQKILRQHGFKASMSGKGNCYPSHACKHALPGNGQRRRRNLLQNHQGRADLATIMGNTTQGRDGDLRIHQWLLQSAPPTLSTGLEKPCRLRTEGGLNEHLGRHESATGPV